MTEDILLSPLFLSILTQEIHSICANQWTCFHGGFSEGEVEVSTK